jgi:hypothetical protein
LTHSFWFSCHIKFLFGELFSPKKTKIKCYFFQKGGQHAPFFENLLTEKGVNMLRFSKAAAAKKGSTSAGMTDKFHSEKQHFFYRSEGVSLLRYIQPEDV